MINTCLSSMVVIHPFSQNVSIDISARFLRSGNIWASLAFNERPVIGISAVFVEFIISPFGIRIGSDTLAIFVYTR